MATETAMVSTERQPPATATVDEKAINTVIDSASIGISLPEGLEFLGSGQANPEIIDAESAVAAAYLSRGDSRNLYDFFLATIEDDGWFIVDASGDSQSSSQKEISAHNGEVALLIEVWDLDGADIIESVGLMSEMWSIELSPKRLAGGTTLVFTATMPCSPDLPIDCE